MSGPNPCSVSKCQVLRSVLADVFRSIKLPALAALVLAATFAMLLVACGGEGESTTASSQGQPEATSTVEAMMEEATPTPEPTPVDLGDCRDGMRLQPGEACRYTGGGSPPANVVLSVQHDEAICREGGPVKQEIGGGTINVDSLRLCSSGGFERDDAFQSDIAASANADGSWTFYESELSASAPRSTASAAPTNTPTPAPPLNVYESGQTIPDFPSGLPNVVRGGASLQMVGGNIVITMGNGGTVEYSHATYTCVSGEGCGIENGRVTTGTIQVADPADVESPTPIPTAAPQPAATPRPTATPTPEPTPTPKPTPVRPGKFSEFDGAGAATWRRMHEGGQIVACYEGLALPRDSFCLSEGFRFTSDYSEILDTKFLVAHLPDGDALVLQGNTKSRAGGDIRLGWITFENRVITHLDFNASQASTPVATPTPTPARSDSDRAVLVALYHSTGGANWDANANWLSDRPIAEWHGVSTDSNGRVIRLALQDNNLTGTLPAELGGLSNLTELVLYNNHLTGEIPPELGGLSNLTALSLYANQLTGEIPPELGRMYNLTGLALNYNRLRGEIPTELGGLSNLIELALHSNELTGEVPTELGDLSNLTWLSLESNHLTGCIPEGLRDIANNDLVSLNLPDCSAATPTAVPTRTATPTPTPTATPTPTPYPTVAAGMTPLTSGVIHFSRELTESQRERITNDVRYTEQILADRFGVEHYRYTLYVAKDWSDAYDLLTEHERSPSFPRERASGGCPGVAANLILVNPRCYKDPFMAGYGVANEVVSSAPRTTPLDHDLSWGFVTYVGFAALGPEREADAVAGYISEARAFSVPLAETYNLEIPLDTRPLKFLAIVYLAETFGDQNLIRYFESLSTGGNTETALEHAFGLSLDEFHANFESYRRIVAPPVSSDSDRIILMGQEALEQADEIRRIVSTVEQWFEERFGYPAGNAVWRVYSRDSKCALASSTAIRIGKPCLLAESVYAHEYFHVLQRDWSTPEGEGQGSSRRYPSFMSEGSARFVAHMYTASMSGRAWADIRAEIVTRASRLEIALDDPTLEIHPLQPQYTLGALATEWLVARSGGKSVADYFYALSQQELRPEDGERRIYLAYERAFREFWGISSDEFYRQFACWRDRGFPLAEAGKECVSP